MDRIELLRKMIKEHRLGFMMDEVMSGTHHFIDGAGPEGELPMEFRVTWGTRHLGQYLNPFGSNFMSNFLEGTVSVGGLIENAPCRGTLDLRYFSEAKIRYSFTFKGPSGEPLSYVGEKIDIRPWNLHRTHTTCYGTITNLKTGKDISRSILYFRMSTVPAFLKSMRLG